MAILEVADDTLAVKVGNLALHHIGVSQTIVSLGERSREAMTISLQFDHHLRSCLREFSWPFATKYLELTSPIGTVAVPVNPDWIFAYAWPSDCIKVRRFVDAGTRRKFNRNPLTFRIGREGSARVIYTDVGAAVDPPVACIEYTAIFDCPETESDELFIGALAWRVAASIAPALAQDDKMADKAWAMYLHTIALAESASANESEGDEPGEASWIAARR